MASASLPDADTDPQPAVVSTKVPTFTAGFPTSSGLAKETTQACVLVRDEQHSKTDAEKNGVKVPSDLPSCSNNKTEDAEPKVSAKNDQTATRNVCEIIENGVRNFLSQGAADKQNATLPTTSAETGSTQPSTSEDVTVETETQKAAKSREDMKREARRKTLKIIKKKQDKAFSMPLLAQTGKLVVGAGAERESLLRGIGVPKVRARMMDCVKMAKKYAMEQSVKHVLMKQTMAHQQNQQKITMYAQALSYMARIYVGGIGYECKEDIIRHAFGPFGPIKNVTLSWDHSTGQHRGFAFVEYEVPEAAMLAEKHMNCQNLAGRMIRVECIAYSTRNQPNPQCQPVVDMILTEGSTFNRVYVASVHQELTEDDLTQVFEAFGEIKSCNLAKLGHDIEGHRGYGYIEYEKEQSVTDAVTSMHLFDLGGMFLRVGKGVTPPAAQSYVVPTYQHDMPRATAVAAAKITAKVTSFEASAEGGPSSGVGAGIAPRVVIGLDPADIAHAREIAQKAGTSLVAVPPPGLAVPSALGASVRPVDDGYEDVDGGDENGGPHDVKDGEKAGQAVSGEKDGQNEAPIDSEATPDVKDNDNAPAAGADDKNEDKQKEVKPKEDKPKMSKSAAKAQARKRKKALGGVAIPHAKPKIDPADGVSGMAAKPAGFGLPPREECQLFDGQMPEYRLHAVPVVDQMDPSAIVNGVAMIQMGVNVVAPDANDQAKGAQRHPKEKPAVEKTEAKSQKDKDKSAKAAATKVLQSVNLAAKRKDLLEDSDKQGTLASIEQLTIKGNDQRNMLMHKLMRNKQSNVIVLRNMVVPSEVDDQLHEEVQEECAKFGRPIHITICQEERGSDLPDLVKIFVKFALPSEASNAQKAFNGRWFGGRQIACDIYDQNLFEHEDLSG